MIVPGVEAYIQRTFGDDALTSRTDIVTRVLVSNHRGTLGDLSRFDNLSGVNIFVGSEIPMDEIGRIKGLRRLTFWDCDVVDISPLAACKTLRMVEFNRCLIRDLTPVMDLPKLTWFSVTGCPLNDRSYQEFLPELWENRDIERFLNYPPEAWRITRKLHDRGAACSCWVDDYGDTRITAPGVEGHKLGSPGLTEAQVDEVLAGVNGDLDAATFIGLARAFNRRLDEAAR